MTNKGKTWSLGTNSRLPFAVNVKLTGLKCSCGKNRDLGNRASPPPHERIKTFIKDIEVRRDLGNGASPVNRAHMKRPSLFFYTSKDYYVDVLCIDPATEKLTFYGTKSSESTENSQTSIR